jgi:hypothetical protein
VIQERLEPTRGPGAEVSLGVITVGDERLIPLQHCSGLLSETRQRNILRLREVFFFILLGRDHFYELGSFIEKLLHLYSIN